MQPWAALLALSLKRIETRPWRTNFRGRLAIHASARQPPGFHDLCNREPFRSSLLCSPWNPLPRGALLGTVEVYDCVRVEDLDAVSETERSFGNFTPGRWAWLLAEPCPAPFLVPVRGRLGVFEIDEALLSCAAEKIATDEHR
jgi:hypothetical protein